ncbi:SDR family NAD(P)-dependent oxidoreductase [Bdellovibrionota bacterium FG-2]
MSVFITGASSGIGAACAKAFAALGYDLILAARREDRLGAVATEIRGRYRVGVETFVLDVRKRKAVDGLISGNLPLFKGVEILVNNAGLAKGFSSSQTGDPDEWDLMIDTNLKGLLYVSRQMLPLLIERGAGHVINMGSVAGRWAYSKGNAYCATKAAVKSLSESMRIDLHGTGVRVTEIAPGMVETEFAEVRFGGDKAQAKQVYQGLKPLSAEDIAEVVVWSAQRPAHVNIQEVVVFPTAQSSVHLVDRSR